MLRVMAQLRAPALGCCVCDGVGLLPAECQLTAHDFLRGLGTGAGKNCSSSPGFSTADYAAGWQRAAVNVTAAWSYSPPDLSG